MTDMISFDTYQYNDPGKEPAGLSPTQQQFTISADMPAVQTNVNWPPLQETGYEAFPHTWWTDVLHQKIIGTHRISYVLVYGQPGYKWVVKKMHLLCAL